MSDDANGAWGVLKAIVTQKWFWYLLAGTLILAGGFANYDRIELSVLRVIAQLRGAPLP